MGLRAMPLKSFMGCSVAVAEPPDGHFPVFMFYAG